MAELVEWLPETLMTNTHAHTQTESCGFTLARCSVSTGVETNGETSANRAVNKLYVGALSGLWVDVGMNRRAQVPNHYEVEVDAKLGGGTKLR